MNVFSEYSQPTIDFIWELLEDAYEDEDKLDKILDEIADEVFAEVKKILLDMIQKKRYDQETTQRYTKP